MRRMRTIQAAAAIGCLATLFQTTGLSAAVPAGFYVILGPINYHRTTGPTRLGRTFTAPDRGSGYVLKLFNGGDHGQFKPVSSASVFLNGRQLLRPSDFNQNVALLERPLNLAARNEIAVEIQ